MTPRIDSFDGATAYDLIYPGHLSMLSVIEQETMKRALMNSSRIWLGHEDFKIIALWGLIPPTLMSEIAYLWLFTTKEFTEYTFTFVRQSQRVVAAMLEEYPTIVGHGVVGHDRSLRWLRWLGAEFGEPQGKFLPFTIRARKWQQDSAQSA